VKRKKTKERSIRGIIIPGEWDENGKVIGIAIETTDEEKYLVYKNNKGNELLEFTQYKVGATGTMTADEHGDMTIKVNRYNLIRGNDEEEEGYR
jgi:co-chaperonin GroES (HSP10)